MTNRDHPRPSYVIDGRNLISKFGLDGIYSFGGIAIVIFRRFGLKLRSHVATFVAHAQNQRQIYFRD